MKLLVTILLLATLNVTDKTNNLFESVLQNQAMRISAEHKKGIDVNNIINTITNKDFK